MKSISVAILVYGAVGSNRNALIEEKYKDLAMAFVAEGFQVVSKNYNDNETDKLRVELLDFDMILVWVNPVEQGHDRKKLDALLIDLTNKGCLVSTHPETILKIGTKKVLYDTKDMDWGGDIRIYTQFEDFRNEFLKSFEKINTRVLKKYRGNGGEGVYKVIYNTHENNMTVIHAKEGNVAKTYSLADFYNLFKSNFSEQGLLINQEWNEHIDNGMVRCYLTGNGVSGFGYQEVNALYTSKDKNQASYVMPSKRYYFSEHCGLFSDLKEVMETQWVPELQQKFSITDDRLPVIWDADFFINDVNGQSTPDKYTLCEINVSCVSPFPPSAIQHIVHEVERRANIKSQKMR